MSNYQKPTEPRKTTGNINRLTTYSGIDIKERIAAVRPKPKTTVAEVEAQTTKTTLDEANANVEYARRKEWDKVTEDRRILENKLLLDFVDLEKMPTTQFIELAHLSIEKADQVIDRIEAAQQLVLYNDMNIILPPNEQQLLEDFIGKTSIDKSAAQCLNKLAFYNDATAALNKASTSGDALKGSTKVLDDMFKDDRLAEAFPEFGISLIIQILIIVYNVIVKSILGQLCKLLSKLFGTIPRLTTPTIPPLITKPLIDIDIGGKMSALIQEAFNTAGDILLLMPNKLIAIKVPNNMTSKRIMVPIYKLVKIKPYVKGSVKVCSDSDIDIEQEVMAMAVQATQPGNLGQSYGNETEAAPAPNAKCNPDYVPTYQERAMAQRLIEAGIRVEMGATSTTKGNGTETPSKQSTLTEYTMLEKMKSDSQHYVASSKMMMKQTEPQPGYFVADQVDSAVLGFFANLNGIMQQVDNSVSKILALEFIDRKYKPWICCIVRFIYIMLPRAMVGAVGLSGQGDIKAEWGNVTNFVNGNEKLISDTFDTLRKDPVNSGRSADDLLTTAVFEVLRQSQYYKSTSTRDAIIKYAQTSNYRSTFWIQYYIKHGSVETYTAAGGGNVLDRMDYIENVKMWIKVIDTLLSLLLGSASLNINFDNLLNPDFFLGVIKKAVAEGLSVLSTALYRDLKEKMFGVINEGFRELPDLKQALEACEPFNWFLNMMECSVENLFGKIQEILARIWSDANDSLGTIDFMISLSMNNKSLKFFQDLLGMLMKWDNALINFCSLKTIATEAEQEEILKRAEDAISSTAEDAQAKALLNSQLYQDTLNKTGIVFDQTIPVGPEAVNNDVYTGGLNSANVFFRDARTQIDIANNIPGSSPKSDNPVTLLDIAKFQTAVGIPGTVSQISPMVNATVPQPAANLSFNVKSCGNSLKFLLQDRLDTINELHSSILT